MIIYTQITKKFYVVYVGKKIESMGSTDAEHVTATTLSFAEFDTEQERDAYIAEHGLEYELPLQIL